MVIIVKLIGVVIVGMGTLITLNPGVFKAVINFWKKDKRIYLAGVARLVLGAIFLLASPACKLPVVMATLGVLVIIGGILIFVIGPARMRTIFSWWEARPPVAMRLMGLVALAIGATVIFSA
jgi:uncharacterized membrane protein HdeD (DUF308 family)